MKGEKAALLHVTQFLQPGGLERLLLYLCRAQKKSGRRVGLFVYDEVAGQPRLDPLFEEAGVEVYRSQKKSGFSCATLFRLWNLCRREKFSLLHSHDAGPFVYAGLARLLTPRRLRHVHTSHGHHPPPSKALCRLSSFLARRAHRLCAVSDEIARRFGRNGLDVRAACLVPNGIDERGLERNLKLRPGLLSQMALSQDFREAQWLLYCARMAPLKGQLHFLAIWSALPAELRRKSLLIFAGAASDPDFLRTLSARVAAAPDADHIALTGPLLRPEDFFRASDFFISASLCEGHPLSPMEAQAAGLPLFLSQIAGHAGFAPHAHFFNPIQPRESATRLAILMQEPAKPQSFVAHPLSHTLRRYDEIYESPA